MNFTIHLITLLSTGIANINTISEINYILNKTNTIVNRANWQLSINNTDNEPGSFLVSNKDLIDSIITFQLRKHNVKTLHEFGMYSPATNSMLVQRTGAYPDKLIKEAYVYDLAPISSLFAPPNKLLLYFPYEKGFIARQIWKLLAVSIFLFLVIIFSFSFQYSYHKPAKKTVGDEE